METVQEYPVRKDLKEAWAGRMGTPAGYGVPENRGGKWREQTPCPVLCRWTQEHTTSPLADDDEVIGNIYVTPWLGVMSISKPKNKKSIHWKQSLFHT